MDHLEALNLLGLPINSSLEDVEKAYRKLAPKIHPDKDGGSQEKMSLLNQARDILRAYFASPNLPILKDNLDIAIRNFSSELINRRTIEKKAEKISKEDRNKATNNLRKMRKLVLIFGAISTIALFFGKDLPKEFFEPLKAKEIELPAKVDKPAKPNVVARYESMNRISNPQKKENNLIIEAFDTEEKKTIESYNNDMKNYKLYLDKVEVTKNKNREIREFNKKYSSVWLLLTFGCGISSGFAAWNYNMRIRNIEMELDDFFDKLQIKSEYVSLVNDIFAKAAPYSWTQELLEKKLREWDPNNDTWHKILRAIGTRKFALTALIKGQEFGFLKIHDQSKNSNSKEFYSFAENI